MSALNNSGRSDRPIIYETTGCFRPIAAVGTGGVCQIDYSDCMKITNKNRFYPLGLALALAVSGCSAPNDSANNGPQPLTAFDPVSMDPASTDTEFPARSGGWQIDVDDSPVNIWLWHPSGQGPYPTIVLLHGGPGWERNMDLARVLQRAGFNVVAFTHRGFWGSGGFNTQSNGLEDIAAVVDEIRGCVDDPECPIPIDPAKIAYLGHSYGGFRAMLSIMEVQDISCAAVLDTSLGPSPTSVELREYVAEHGDIPPEEKEWEERNMAPNLPFRIERVGAWSADLLKHADRFDLKGRIDELAKERLFVLSSTLGDNYSTLVETLEEHGANQLRNELWDTDHGFNGRRVELARAMVDYFTNDCFD